MKGSWVACESYMHGFCPKKSAMPSQINGKTQKLIQNQPNIVRRIELI